MKINSILQYRTQIMGFSALWILLFHSYGSGLYDFLKPFKPLLAYGWAGVDIFLFLSGLGIGLSLQKKPTFLQFIQRRLKRIFLPYFIGVCFLHIFVYNFDIIRFLLDVTTIGYWIPYNDHYIISFWYVCVILFFYVISYPIFFLLKKYTKLFFIIFCAISFIVYFQTDYANFVFGRIPIYFLGMLLSLYTNHEFKRHIIIIITIISLTTFILLSVLTYNWGGNYITELKIKIPSFFLITPGIIISLTKLFDVIKIKKFVNKIFSFFGSISLEIYLVHWAILMFLKEFNIELNWILYLALSILFSLVIKQIATLLKL